MAGWSLKVSRDAFRLTRTQDERRRPQLVPALLNGYFLPLQEGAGRGYSFNLSISNRSEADNADIALLVTYKTAGIPITAKISPHADSRPGVLSIPQKISAHDTLSGWCRFRLDQGIARGNPIERYRPVFTDTHGREALLEPQILRERQDG